MKRGTALVVAVVAVLLTAAIVRAQFSPGDLSKPHHQLEGLRNCEKCHEPGSGLANQRCLSCHTEIGKRIESKHGFHGRSPTRDLNCESCHHEHRGEGFDLAGLDERTFDHGRTGFPLEGKHQRAKCASCHDPRFIDDKSVTTLRERTGRKTFLGVSNDCATCHFDEHRGQLGAKCETCHTAAAWKPPTKFNHGSTEFPLTGQHRKVACAKCHATLEDKEHAGAFPAPRAASFMKTSDVAHGACTSCHDDAHDGHFGQRCQSCHTTEGWHSLSKTAADSGFHDKTRFPLRGGHIGVPCKQCHAQSGKKQVFKGLPFAACTDCHADVHVGQLPAARAKKGATCDACHTVDSFEPTTFSIEQHAGTTFPLEGAHTATPCNSCHTADPKVKKAASKPLLAKLTSGGRSQKLVDTVFHFSGSLERCETCHRDPHAGQFKEKVAAQGCVACHKTTSFHDLTFDHGRDTSFPLAGAHASVTCGRCHEVKAGRGGEKTTVYKPVATTCAACHTDVHRGQLAAADGTTACETCHETTQFKTTRFDHDQARFKLTGQHASKECSACHSKVAVAGMPTTRFKPLPTRCGECHLDAHAGAYATPELASIIAGGDVPDPSGLAPCEVCHRTEGWLDVRFAQHDRTSFPLRGAHAKADCAECHKQGYAAAMVHDCSSCHRDPHAGSLGMQCAGCHDSESWRSAFDALAHQRRGFPLVGRHALLPCQECHPAQQRGFAATPLRCVDCHEAQYERAALTSIDHPAAGFGTRCEQCHDTVRFRPARFPQHDSCFALTGPHGGIACRDCHTSLAGATASGACATNTAACTNCHEHRCTRTDTIHRDVSGYQCRDRKCFECHRFAE